jgi:DNA repair exonuclease SbcCD ATPase subunit
MAVDTLTASMTAFAERHTALLGRVEAARARREQLEQELADATAEQLLSGKNTNRRQEGLREQLTALDSELRPLERTLAEAERMRAKAEQAAAEHAYADASAQRKDLREQWLARVAALRSALKAARQTNAEIAALWDADEKAYYRQQEAAQLLGADRPTQLPIAHLDERLDHLISEFESLVRNA